MPENDATAPKAPAVNTPIENVSQAYEQILGRIGEMNKSLKERAEEAISKSREATEGMSDMERRVRNIEAQRLAANPNPRGSEESEKGLDLARTIRCLVMARNSFDGTPAAAYAEKLYGADSSVLKALTASSGSGGGLLIPGVMGSDFIELLRNKTVIESSGPRRVPLDHGSITIPKLTGGASGSWIGEGTNITNAQQTFGNVTLTAKKYATLTPISNDLIQYADDNVERMVRDDLLRDAAIATDLAFLRGDGTAAQPRGLRNQVGITTFDRNSTVNLQNVTNDLGRAVQEQLDGNVDPTSAHWFFVPRTWRYLLTIRGGDSFYGFREELEGGTLFGFPWKMTNQIPTNLGAAGDESEVYFVNMDDVVVGTANEVQVAVSDTAAYHDGSNVQATFSRDESVIRVIVKKDIAVRHPESVVVITAVDWAA